MISEFFDREECKCKQKYEGIRTTFLRHIKKAVGNSSGRGDILLKLKYEKLRWLAIWSGPSSKVKNLGQSAKQ